MHSIASGEWIQLGHQLTSGMSAAGPSGAVTFTSTSRSINDSRALTVTRMDMAVHVGTHIDAACHFIRGGCSMEMYPLSTFIGEGVVMDIRRSGVTAVSAADLADANPGVKQGDIVLLCFGYGRHFGTNKYRFHPYLTVDAAEWLHDHGAKLVGMDTLGPDLPEPVRPEGFSWPVHQTLLSGDVLIMENLTDDLEPLCGKRLEIHAVPLVIAGADGGPCSPIVRPLV